MRSTTGGNECPRNPSGTTVSPPSTTAPPTTTTSPPTSCTTVSGADPGEACVFPFRFNGVLYNECAFDGNAPGETEPWCSTLTNSNDDHQGGQGRWGFCSSECPVVSTTTTLSPAGCTTVGGGDPGKACVFPFRFRGTLFNRCTLVGNAPGETEPWCSTLTNSNDDHQGGQGRWGFCSPTCPAASVPNCEDSGSAPRCRRRCRNAMRCESVQFCRNECRQTCGFC